MQLSPQNAKILVIPDVGKFLDFSVTVSYGIMSCQVSDRGIQS